MKRWPLRILVCLILGAVTTVAVAWGFTVDRGPYDILMAGDGIFHADSSVEGPVFLAFHHARTGRRAVDVAGTMSHARFSERYFDDENLSPDRVITLLRVAGNRRLPSWSAAWGSTFSHANLSDDLTKTISDRGFGWPLLSMRYHWWAQEDSTGTLWTRDTRWAWILGESNSAIPTARLGMFWNLSLPNPVAMPLRPIWSGFLINTLFYAAIWFGVFFGFTSAKRAIRRKRGRCPRCGYDLRGELPAGCSECGWNRAR